MIALGRRAKVAWSALRGFLDGFLGVGSRGIAASAEHHECATPKDVRDRLASRASARRSCC